VEHKKVFAFTQWKVVWIFICEWRDVSWMDKCMFQADVLSNTKQKTLYATLNAPS